MLGPRPRFNLQGNFTVVKTVVFIDERSSVTTKLRLGEDRFEFLLS